jgi:NAD(P)-dependent dehydrogenase (short-subunit alcohol dehydrogenase family)
MYPGIGGRVVIVARAASLEIGFGAALEPAREGARVFPCSRDKKRVVAGSEVRIKDHRPANVK